MKSKIKYLFLCFFVVAAPQISFAESTKCDDQAKPSNGATCFCKPDQMTPGKEFCEWKNFVNDFRPPYKAGGTKQPDGPITDRNKDPNLRGTSTQVQSIMKANSGSTMEQLKKTSPKVINDVKKEAPIDLKRNYDPSLGSQGGKAS